MATENAERGRKARKLILCFDGTGNKFHGDDSDSNILKIFRMLDRTADDQYHYYQPGIGTYVTSSSLSRTSLRARFNSWYMKAKDSAIGSSFDQHVVGGYRFLMRFYSPGDEIYIFGFSRGAYIARFLAEMLDYVGLLSHGNEEMVQFAWKAFSQWQCRRSANSDEESAKKKKKEMYEFMKGFRETFSRPVRRIRFLGLFDTVNSVPRFETAWMERSKFPYTARSSAKVIRHAVSIDERRAKFRQDLMYQSEESKKTKQHGHGAGVFHDMHEKYRRHSHASQADGTTGRDNPQRRGRKGERLQVPGEQSDEPVRYRAHSRSKSRASHESRITGDNMSACSKDPPISDIVDYDSEDETEQDIDEVWFAGGHGDIGGGWDVEVGSKSASHVPLVWMVREAMKAGLNFDIEKVVKMGCSEALDSAADPMGNIDRQQQGPVPDIRVEGASPLDSPVPEDSGARDIEKAECSHPPMSPFHEMMCKAHLARTHDSLSFDCGMSRLSVLSWKMMEYLPFRRMDLRPDGSWKPIRWPLPCGEVRDVPHNARVHGSVIRRMKMDEKYRPGNLIVGGGGRGCRSAPEEYGMGNWICVADEGDPIGEIWVKRT